MPIEELAKQTEVLIGLLITIMTLMGFVVRWFWGRVKGTVNDGVAGLAAGHEEIAQKVQRLEGVIDRVDTDVKKVSSRVVGIEAKMQTLAKSSDMNALAVTLGEVRATGNATSTMVDTLYRSVMDRADRGR